jgi:predicted DNA binding CopG/RHH family protein
MKEDKRTKLLTVRVSPSEMAAMKEAAEKEGLSLSKLVRRETLKPKPGDGQRVTKP